MAIIELPADRNGWVLMWFSILLTGILFIVLFTANFEPPQPPVVQRICPGTVVIYVTK